MPTTIVVIIVITTPAMIFGVECFLFFTKPLLKLYCLICIIYNNTNQTKCQATSSVKFDTSEKALQAAVFKRWSAFGESIKFDIIANFAILHRAKIHIFL